MKAFGLAAIYRWWLKRRRAATVSPAVGAVDFGDLRVLAPVSREFGYDRGIPIDRYYIERFLAENRDLISGRVLEIGDDEYTRRFGGVRVSVADVLDVDEGNPKATLVGDLVSADHIPSDSFDCIVFTQTLQFIFEHQAALATLYRILKPGGALLATVPGISKIPQDRWGEFCAWSYTRHSARRLFGSFFPDSSLVVESMGNVLAAIAFLHGLASRELSTDELEFVDPLFQVLISIRAIKAGRNHGGY